MITSVYNKINQISTLKPINPIILNALEPILESIKATFVTVIIRDEDNFVHAVTGSIDDATIEKQIFILENHIKMLKKNNLDLC